MTEEKTLMNTTGELSLGVSELSITLTQKDTMGNGDTWIEIPRPMLAYVIKAIADELTAEEVLQIVTSLMKEAGK